MPLRVGFVFMNSTLKLTSWSGFLHSDPGTSTVMVTPQTLSKVEGDMLQLSCEVTRQTSQHTHVSVGWYLRPSDDPDSGPRDLVTLSRDFVLRPGGQYRQRLSSGDLRLDKTSATSYRLTIYKMQPTDQGEFYCEASEWIQDPDRSWYAMTRKESEKTSVKVQPTGEWEWFGGSSQHLLESNCFILNGDAHFPQVDMIP